MKTKKVFAFVLLLFGSFFESGAQNWIAEIRVNINHGSYAIEKVSGTISYSGIIYNLAETTAPALLQITGSGDPNGQLVINLTGKAMFPYPNQNPEPAATLDLSASYNGNHNTFNCTTQLFANNDGIGSFDGQIRLIPRTSITASDAPMSCEDGSFPLTASSCASNIFEWRVGSNDIGPFSVIVGETTSVLNITRPMLNNMGLGSNSQIYVIATGVAGTTSSPKLIKVYSPASLVVATAVQPICHDGAGSVSVVITPSHANITKFDVSLYDQPVNGSALSPQIDDAPKIFNYPNVPIGTWWITVRNDTDVNTYGNCITARIPVTGTINNPPEITIQLSISSSITCKDADDGIIHATMPLAAEPIQSFVWTGPGTGNGKDIINCAPGNYSLAIVDNNGCAGSTNSSLALAEPSLFSISLSPTNITCFGDHNGAIVSNPSGGFGGPYTYSWSNNAVTANLTNLGPDNYSLTAHNGKGCQAQASTSITQPDQIVFDIDQDHGIDCPGSPTGVLSVGDVLPAAEYTYLWTASHVVEGEQTDPTLYNKPPGSYSVTVTNTDTGCTASDDHMLEDSPAFTVQIAPTSNYYGSKISCYGESDGELHAQLYNNLGAVANATSYEWKRNGLDHSSGQEISGLDAASYSATATYGLGCTATSLNYNLLQPSPVSVLIATASNHHGHAISCPGENDGAIVATALGGTPGGYSYQWTDGPPTQNFNDLTQGIYFVTVHDINGCEASTSHQLNDPPPVVPAITIQSNYHGQPLTCTGASDAALAASATGGASPYMFNWNTGAQGVILNSIPAGQYSVEASDANGCKAQTQPIQVNDPEPVNASITVLSDYNGQAIQCFDSATGSIRANGEGGTSVYSFIWSTNAITRDISGLIHGNYSVVVSDENGCNDFAAIELINPQPVVAIIDAHSDFNGFGVQCYGSQNGYIHSIATGGTNTFTYNWPALTQTTAQVEDLGPGNYTVIITDSNGCVDEESFEVTEPEVLTLQEQNHTDILCYGGSDGTLQVTSDGGVGMHEYLINNGTWQLVPNFSGLSAEIPYVVTVRDGNQCTETIETQLAQPDEIEIEFSVEPALCADPVGEAAAVVSGGVGNFTYEWSDALGNVINTLPSITKQFAGIYTLLVKDEHQCPMEKSIGISSLDGPVGAVVENRQASCFDSSDGYARIDINGNGPFIVEWENGVSAWEVSGLARGLHYVSVTDVNSCVSVIPVMMLAPEPVAVMLVKKNDVSCYQDCDGVIEVSASGGNGDYIYEWNSQAGAIAINLCTGLHEVEVTDKLGCHGSQAFEIAEPDPVEMRAVERTLPLCQGGCDGSIEVIAKGGTGSFSYSWTSGSTSSIQDKICAGSYTVIATDEMNCEVTRTFDLGEPTKVSIALIESRPPTCHNGCNGTIEVVAIGGAGGYGYGWADGSSLTKNESLCVGDHEVSVVDSNNCRATGKYSIINVPELKIDLGGGVVLCEGQQYELNAGPSWKKVDWSSSGKWISSSPKIVVREPGAYDVKVFDANNCTANDSFVLEVSNNLLEASFIMTAQAVVGDTVVLIDISWPLPDKISWTFPAEMTKLLDNGDVIHAKFEDAGEYNIGLHARLGECNDQITKTITILESSDKNSGGRLGVEEFLKTLTLHPNPNTGAFEVEVEFIEESPITISVWNLVNTLMVTKVSDHGTHHYKKRFDLNPVTSGVYLLRVDFDGGHRTIRFLIH